MADFTDEIKAEYNRQRYLEALLDSVGLAVTVVIAKNGYNAL